MSMFSGKCDLYDHIMMEKQYKQGNCYISDEMECFKIFKELTGGIIYQMKLFELTPNNYKYLAAHSKIFTFEEVTEQIPDKRCKSGFREITTVKYFLYGDEYDIKAINARGGISLNVPIKFNNIIDIAKYYPYIVSTACCSKDSEYIVISDQSYVDEHDVSLRQAGIECNYLDHYRQKLSNHIIKLAHTYFDKDGNELEVNGLSLT